MRYAALVVVPIDHATPALSRFRQALARVPTRFALVSALGVAPAAVAQVPPALPPPIEQLRRPSDLPLPEPPPVPKAPEILVPAPDVRPAAPILSEGARVNARAFRFTGNTVVPEAELQSLAAPFLGRELGNAELEDLRLRITRRYVDAGYVNSGAVIPDQDVTSGTITYEIVEGRLSEILVGGSNRFRPGYLRDRLALGAEPVLNVNQLQERMQLLLQDPQIERIAAELAPGTRPGEAVLRTDVTGAPAFFAGLILDNNRSPVVGANQAELVFGTRNLLGQGETFTLQSATTSGLDDYMTSLAVPLTARGTLFQARYEYTHSRVVEAPFDQLDISARSRSLELGFSHPLIEHPQRSLRASALVAKRSTQNYFLGEPSPFIPGAPDGRFNVSVLRLGLDGVDRSLEHVLAGRVLLSVGLNAFGATVGDGFPDSQFTAVLAQIQWVQRSFSPDGQFVLRAEAQFANDALPGLEKYSLGGMDNVRGYRKDVFVRDNGWFGSIEYRHTIAHLALREGAGAGEGAIRAALFADIGQARNHDGPSTNPPYIASVGPGMRWEPVAGLDAVVYWGYALRDVTTATTTSQDRGWHIRVSYSKAF